MWINHTFILNIHALKFDHVLGDWPRHTILLTYVFISYLCASFGKTFGPRVYLTSWDDDSLSRYGVDGGEGVSWLLKEYSHDYVSINLYVPKNWIECKDDSIFNMLVLSYAQYLSSWYGLGHNDHNSWFWSFFMRTIFLFPFTHIIFTWIFWK